MKDGFSILVAEDEMQIVGFIVFRMESGHGYIDNICVTKERQGRGIGKALVTRVEEITKSNEFGSIRTDTTENAEGIPWKSYGFWTSLGYIDTGERLATPYDFKEIPFIKKLG